MSEVSKPLEGIVLRENVLLMPVMDIGMARQRLIQFQEFVKGYLVVDEDFGTIPGTPKPTLYKPGADKLCELYGLADKYVILTQVEDFKADPPLFDYTIECQLVSRRDDSLVASGLGSCNSYESKYKLRDSQRKCPSCSKAAIIRGQEKYGGGWVCWKKKDGCGMKFADGDQAIEGQSLEKVFNDDIPTLKNTILKMAKKRAKIDATLSATRSSGIFTQDIEDMRDIDDSHGRGSQKAADEVAARKIAEHQAKPSNDGITFTIDPSFAGMVRIGGSGSAIAKFKGAISESDSAVIIWLDNAKCFAFPEELLEQFQNLAKFYDVNSSTIKGSPANAAKTGKAVGTPAESAPTNLPIIKSAVVTGEGVKQRLVVHVSNGSVSNQYGCFDTKLWPILIAGVNQTCKLEIKVNGKYQNIVDVAKIGDRSYENGKPVPTMNDPAKGFTASDDDIPESMF